MKKLFAILFCFLFLISFLTIQAEAAKSRGGSSGGFKSKSSSSSSSSSGSSSYSRPHDYSSPSGNYGNRYSPGYSGGGTTIVPIYGGSPTYATGSGGGGGVVFLIIILAIVGVVVFIVIKNRKKKGSGEIDGDTSEAQLFFIQAGFFYGKGELEESLVQTAKAVDTGDSGGLLTLLREVSMLIRRNKDSIRWFNFKKTSHKDESTVEAVFEKLVTDERMKLDVEEFTDQDGMEVDRRAGGPKLEEVIVINMAVACYCDILLDDKITFENFEKTISFFSAIPEDKMLGTNVVWNITDKDELIAKYPELRSV